jgi:hypothetical protein
MNTSLAYVLVALCYLLPELITTSGSSACLARLHYSGQILPKYA